MGGATCGRRTQTLIVTDSGHVILSAIQSSTLAQRLSEALASASLRPGATPALPEALQGALGRTWDLINPHLPDLG